LGGGDVPSVLEEILGMMRLPEGLDLPRIRDLLCEREQVATTGLGDGVAFPHCRDIALPGLSFPVVSLAFLERAIDFSAIDNQPVKIVFTLLSPSSAQSIRLMSRLAYAVRKPAFLEQLKAEAPRDSIFQAAKEVDMELDAGR
jgi:PTS system nitrogen regulatory IIA component